MAENNVEASSNIMGGDNKCVQIPIEEITLKIKTYINLCRTNKINTSNAFDIDMVEYFSLWLKRKKEEFSNNDLEMFQEIADYLEACDKVYGYRVDNASSTTSKLVEEFKTMHFKQTSTEEDSPKYQQFKRTKCMLTTADKINSKLADKEYGYCSFLADVRDFDLNTIFLKHKPSNYINSLYNKLTLKEEIDLYKENNKVDPNKPTDYVECDLAGIQEILDKEVICPEFHGFVSEHDELKKDDEYDELDGIEDRFDIDGQNQYFVCDTPDNIIEFNELPKLGTPDFPEQSNIAELVKCVDGVDRPYSFFNPKLFANFKGPKAWKTQTMIKSLKSCEKNEQKEIMAIPDIDDDVEMKSDIEYQLIKKRKKKIEVNIHWYTFEELEAKWQKSTGGKISLVTIKKWNPIDQLMHFDEPKVMKNEIKFQSTLLKNHKVKRDQDSCDDSSSDSEDSDDFHRSVLEREVSDDMKNLEIKDFEEPFDIKQQEEEEEEEEEEESYSKNDNFPAEFKTESKMDMFELKRKISMIIDEECIKLEFDNYWSSQLSFKTLLLKLMATETGISLHIVFVALLHLTNERGLKLIQEPGSLENIRISKPITKPS